MKNCLVREYKYGVLVTNLPNNMKKETVAEIAQRALKNLISQSYTMSTYDYIVNPDIMYNHLHEKAFQDSKKKCHIRNIDFRIDYNEIKKDDRFKYIFSK